MKLNFWQKEFWQKDEPKQKRALSPTAQLNGTYSKSYDGEKNLGEAGPIIYYYLDYYGLAARSWQAYIESNVAQMIIKRYCGWIIGPGLRLNSKPSKAFFKSEGINFDTESFNEVVEARWNVWANSRKSGYGDKMNLSETAHEVIKNAVLGGDCLVILRYIDDTVKVQIVDGQLVSNPPTGYSPDVQIYNGIEIDSTGRHIAYHVRVDVFKWERVPAISKSSGMVTAFLVSDSKYRMDTMRGLPLLGSSLESLKKMERYQEAAVGSAEERQKIAYFIEHGVNSDGSMPQSSGLMKAFDANANGDADLPLDEAGNQLANTIAASTDKQVFNMTKDATIKVISSQQEMFFRDFIMVNIEMLCAAIEMPPNVALQKYNDSFSASRAATKDWDHTMGVKRNSFQIQFYQVIYNYWLYIEILKGKIQSPGYLAAFASKNFMLVEAYQMCKFTGELFPHIDPLKEVKAEREKLGSLGAHLPLTTVEAATEALGTGDSDSNMEQYSRELDYAEELGIEAETPVIPGAIEPEDEDQEDDTKDKKKDTED